MARNFAVLAAAIAVATGLALAACSDPLRFAEAWDVQGSVAYTSSSADRVVAEMVIVNRSLATLSVASPQTCPPLFDIEARRTGEAANTPSWSYRDYFFEQGFPCLLAAIPPLDVEPGGSVAYAQSFAVSDILGDSLEAGGYAFTGVALFLGKLDDGTHRTVDLGTLSLGLDPTGPALGRPVPTP